MLRNQIVPAIRETILEEQFDVVWFQQDGCTAHKTREVQEFLHDAFGGRVIANRGPISWPARSPDITPLDFYLWGYDKNEVYEFEPPATREILEERTRHMLGSVNRNTLGIRNILKRCQKCDEKNGLNFEL